MARSGSPRMVAYDGRFVVFSKTENRTHGLWLIDSDGSHPRLLVGDIGLSDSDSPGISWSPDGRSLAFQGFTGRQYGLQVMDLIDRRPRMFDSFGERAVWSPDGSHIAYLRYRRDQSYEFVRRKAGGGRPVTFKSAPIPGPPTEPSTGRPVGAEGFPRFGHAPAEGTGGYPHLMKDTGLLARPLQDYKSDVVLLFAIGTDEAMKVGHGLVDRILVSVESLHDLCDPRKAEHLAVPVVRFRQPISVQ